jgi:hypothetical protein
MSEWKPIETAPRDGSTFVTYLAPCRANDGSTLGHRYDFAQWDTETEDFIQHGCGFCMTTHWMPLPNPPEA